MKHANRRFVTAEDAYLAHMKTGKIKPKPCRATGCEDETWFGPEGLLPVGFRWEPPALALATRRDEASLPLIVAMDRAVRDLWSAALASDSMPALLERHAQDVLDLYQTWQDDQVSRNALPIRCSAGCANCCRQYPLGIHAFEVLHIHRHLKDSPDFPHLLQLCRARHANYLEWEAFVSTAYPSPAWDEDDRQALAQEHDLDDGQPCPFLDAHGSCSIHSLRPLTCRMFLSLSDPAYCTSELNTAPEANQVTLPPEEAVTLRLERLDRLLDSWGHDGSLFGSLVRLHEHLERRSP